MCRLHLVERVLRLLIVLSMLRTWLLWVVVVNQERRRRLPLALDLQLQD